MHSWTRGRSSELVVHSARLDLGIGHRHFLAEFSTCHRGPNTYLHNEPIPGTSSQGLFQPDVGRINVNMEGLIHRPLQLTRSCIQLSIFTCQRFPLSTSNFECNDRGSSNRVTARVDLCILNGLAITSPQEGVVQRRTLVAIASHCCA